LFGVFVDYTQQWSGAWSFLAVGLLLGTGLLLPVRETPPKSH
jgi:hypothetical protein